MTTISSQQPHESETAAINPYAPTGVQDQTQPTGHVTLAGHVSTLTLIISTIAGVTASGGFFGIAYLLCGIWMLVPSDENAAMLVSGAIAGCFVAFFGSLAIVPLMSAVSVLVRTPGTYWSSGGIKLFAAACGFLTGYLSIPFLNGYTPWSIVFGLLPGLVGAVGTTLSVTPLARRAKISWERSAEIDAALAAAADGQVWQVAEKGGSNQ